MTETKPKDYEAALRQLMNLKDGVTHPPTKVFLQEELLAITPTHVVEFFNVKAYGKKNPAPNNKPTKCRSTTLLNYKKKISWFHPQKDQQWDSIWGEGKPTRPQSVNAMIGVVKKHEVRQTGVASQARRAFSLEAFLQLLAITDGITNNKERSSCFCAVATLQWQLIGTQPLYKGICSILRLQLLFMPV